MASIPSARTLQQNIWRGLLSASDQEIRDGLDFYPGAHGLCRLFASMFGTSPRQVAGVYAALSPMNGWDSNVDNVVAVLRHEFGPAPAISDETLQYIDENYPSLNNVFRGPYRTWASPSVNTTRPNLDKALRITAGENPLSVLSGRKVTAFYQAIADPADTEPIPVDRHLICLALDVQPTKSELSRYASDRDVYDRVEAAYADLGRREGLGNRLASVAWFVQRRVALSGHAQRPIPHPDTPVCCSRPMYSHGRPHPRTGHRRWYCPKCRSTRRPDVRHRLVRDRSVTPCCWTVRLTSDPAGYPLWRDARQRACVTLGVGHPYANSGGWQYLARFLVADALGYLPRTDEHTHHKSHDRTDDRLDLSNYELVAASYHGRIHGRASVLARCERTGRFVSPRFAELPDPGPEFDWPRYGPVLGNEARRMGQERGLVVSYFEILGLYGPRF